MSKNSSSGEGQLEQGHRVGSEVLHEAHLRREPLLVRIQAKVNRRGHGSLDVAPETPLVESLGHGEAASRARVVPS